MSYLAQSRVRRRLSKKACQEIIRSVLDVVAPPGGVVARGQPLDFGMLRSGDLRRLPRRYAAVWLQCKIRLVENLVFFRVHSRARNHWEKLKHVNPAEFEREPRTIVLWKRAGTRLEWHWAVHASWPLRSMSPPIGPSGYSIPHNRIFLLSETRRMERVREWRAKILRQVRIRRRTATTMP
jgi:hypothetical protein